MATKICPSETDEQKTFVAYCRIKNIIVNHSPNEGMGGRGGAIRGAKLKSMGTSAGFPDLLCFVPLYGITNEVDAYQMVAIEMKRKQGGRVSQEQKKWLQVLELAGIPAKVCKGAEEAISFIQDYEDQQLHIDF